MSLRNDIRTLRRQVADLDRAVHALIEAHNRSQAGTRIVSIETEYFDRKGRAWAKPRRYQIVPTRRDCTMRRLAGHCPMHDRQVQS
ncbi:MAG: hypothetical protein SO046_02855 [Actinomyces urogenitalis]|uniref:hypothetical protein n=1 Tax=Actinomyces urogenitalis TaxID=103621 RepID=UPI002A812108|nr:hypothetical protein [Actinomyces urogenitalis]MDY3678144.1 hypothetical protein [Actinomyces urogenitalis]